MTRATEYALIIYSDSNKNIGIKHSISDIYDKIAIATLLLKEANHEMETNVLLDTMNSFQNVKYQKNEKSKSSVHKMPKTL